MDQRVSRKTAGSTELAFDAETGRLELVFQGAVRAVDLTEACEKLAELIAERPVAAALIDARRSRAAYSAAELIEALEAALEYARPRRCAFVSDGERPDIVMLMETVGFPYGVRVKAYLDLAEASAWLEE